MPVKSAKIAKWCAPLPAADGRYLRLLIDEVARLGSRLTPEAEGWWHGWIGKACRPPGAAGTAEAKEWRAG